MPVHRLDRVHRPAFGTVAVSRILEVSFENGFQHNLGSGLNHPVVNGWDTERPLTPIRLWDHHPPHRIGPVRLRNQFLAQARQPCLQTLVLDLREGNPIQTRRTRVAAGQPVGVQKDVLTADFVVEHIEAEGGLRLRLAIELSLKAPDLFRCFKPHRQSPSPLHLQKRTRSQGPLLHRHYPASSLKLPCPTPAVTGAQSAVEAATLAPGGSPPITTNHLSSVPCPLV